ncbi:MAG: hypothetical protein K2O45_10935, partial [Oscillospiraceae bacterium]|nr:hypothetical protein [Oscillospiraceae bacterium]
MNILKIFGKRGLALFVSAMMCLGILQTNALAATVQSKLVCTKDAHTHSDSCYKGDLICGEAAAEAHVHTDACYTKESTLTCAESETLGHAHDASCYDEAGELACMQPETEGHSHTDACYTEETVLTCVQPETEGHSHTDACYAVSSEPTCGKEEHKHTADCYSAENVAKDLYDALQNSTDKDVELILNGAVLDLSGYTGWNIRVTEDGQTLTIKDGDVAGGTIKGTGGCRVITILNGGSVTLTGSTVITGGGSSGGAGVFVGNDSTFNMEGGEISGNNTSGINQGGGVLVEGTKTALPTPNEDLYQRLCQT